MAANTYSHALHAQRDCTHGPSPAENVMSEMTSLSFQDFPVRIVHRDGEAWFVAADECKIVGV
jgi:hypothetical protein